MQIFDQGGESLVEPGKVRVLELAMIVRVEIPTAEVESDDASTSFHKSTGQQEMFKIPWGAIAIAIWIALAIFASYRLGLLGNIKRICQPAGGENSKCLLCDLVESLVDLLLVELSTKGVEAS